jgi:ribonuclease-3
LADLDALQKKLGVVFGDREFLEQAMVHSSYINENPDFTSVSNERLEFLGDAILDFIVAEKLYQALPALAEGEMTRLRSVLVRRDTLARVAKAISLGDYLYLGKGEEAGGGRQKSTNLAGALEALLAAVFLDRGINATRELVLRLLGEELEAAMGLAEGTDYKSQLQELVQSRYRATPSYRLLRESGPDHARQFTVEVMIDDKVLGQGAGRSKKMAETEAARQALQRLAADFTS